MKRIGLKLIYIILLGIFLLQGNIVLAESTTDLKNQQSENVKKINEAKEQLDEIKEEKSETMKQVQDLTVLIP